nr:YdcF family protein [Nitrospirota bacterium]
MSKKHNIVCISTIDWDFVWQGHQEIMSALASQGHRVLFIENTGVRRATIGDLPRLKHRLMNWRRGVKGFRRVMDNLYVYAPIVLPFPYSRIARAFNKAVMAFVLRRWTKTMHFENPIVWTWLPTALAMEVIRVVDARLVIYYCCDNFQASSEGSSRIRETEDVLIRTADIVFAHSKALFDRCSRLTDQVHVFQYGFNPQVFSHVGDEPPDLAGIKRPILGYVGGIHKVIDFGLLEQVAEEHPDKSLVLVGPIQTDVGNLSKRHNVHFLGQKRYEDLPTYIRQFDVGLIPYVLNEYSRNVYPTKLNEYLTMGKPVVSTPLPEVAYFNESHQGIVSISETPEAFIKQIDIELQDDNDVRRAQRIRLVEKNAWPAKIEAMQRLIHAKLDEKAKKLELHWQEALTGFSRAFWPKIASAAGAALVLYVLFFYTPLLWKLAEPLSVQDQPVKADVIVVLAGGIGESGQPGEEYQEKVKRAVDLYQQGYAKTILLSSGATYVFNEALVMRALAVSLGVPDAALVVDDAPGGNYLRLLYVRKILDDRGWSRIILVGSHYNGMRSRLVIEKNFPGKTVAIAPAPQSIFFGERQQVTWKHLRAIGHEYVGILYYWLEGYI